MKDHVQPTVSIIMPIYNCEAFVDKCLLSLYAQTEKNIEIIIVDDASTDSSVSRIEELVVSCPKEMTVKIIRHACNKGVSAARNTAVSNASGNYFFFIDSDDWITPDCMEYLWDLAEKHNADVCCGRYEYFYGPNDSKTEPSPSQPFEIYASNEELLSAYCEHRIPVFIWNKLIRRSVFDESNLKFEESISNDEDQLWCFRLMMRVNTWVNSDSLTYHYRKDNPDSITALSVTKRRLSNYYKVLEFMQHDINLTEMGLPQKRKLIAKAIHKFTKSILWHIELDSTADHRNLYEEFRIHYALIRKNMKLRDLNFKDRFFSYGWMLPYPLNRWCSPCYLRKQTKRFLS